MTLTTYNPQPTTAVLAAVVLLLAMATGASAQARGPGDVVTTPSAETSETKRISSPGALLDDHEVMEKGSVSLTFGAGYTKVPSGYDLWLPYTDLSVGLTSRVKLGVATSLARVNLDDFRLNSMGDVYVNAKFKLLNEGKYRPGVAFQPVLELLGRASRSDSPLSPRRTNGAFGGMVGKSIADTVRVYTHTGYFTRGIVFNSGAVEYTRLSRVTPIAWWTYGRLIRNQDAVRALELNTSRLNLGGTMGVRLSKNWTSWISVYRTMGREDFNAVRLGLSGGVSYTFKAWE